ncbi:hypothetical protein HanHA300_Chr03g0095601 [Helianthus annuus]|nr:hypothetical protein HanHA300_Chr03g0095601 [Helianthus annuus]KAJ0608322.1 hypothetical protein HanHA89_Chr03g0107281 [Helianthus annuus]KAJ0768387.1 hypothetical protein HanLR1_Chr03g0100661 [Helianthus annuus]
MNYGIIYSNDSNTFLSGYRGTDYGDVSMIAKVLAYFRFYHKFIFELYKPVPCS